jgi:HPt (histidine-containing phosphotransfer) domain-containing protein
MSDVIDWDEAMQQCGDDEEFLRELLDDLRSETDTQMSKIQETIRVSSNKAQDEGLLAPRGTVGSSGLCCFAHFLSLLFILQNPVDSPFVQIMRASHVIKGAASNLMCAQLRKCAMHLETAASSAANEPSGEGNPKVLQEVKDRYEELKVAVKKYHEYLESVDI